MRLRAFFYQTSILKSYTFPVPVISVGNLTMGGSGKTPIVIYLTRFLQQQGYRPAVVSRGYSGKAAAEFNVVSDGHTLFMDSIEAGDEPRLIAEKATGSIVITGKSRKHPCQYAVDTLNCDVILLDDGFQHLSVNRKIDLVLFNAKTDFKLMHVLPGGILREPFSALNRASAFLITGCNKKNRGQAQKVASYLQRDKLDKPLFKMTYQPSHYVDSSGKEIELDKLTSQVFAFCGIASPDRFIDTIKTLSVTICGTSFFSDHQHYQEDNLIDIVKRAKKLGALALLTTEKDLVKLKAFDIELPLYALCMEVEKSPSLETFILDAISTSSSGKSH